MNTTDLRALLGIQQVSDTLENRLAYSRDASNLAGDCLAVVWPVHLEQVSALAEWACQEGIDLVPRGAGTGLCGGATPQSSVVVDFSRLNTIDSLDIEKHSVHVSAGAVLDILNRKLQHHGLFLPVIPGSHGAASLGGMVATNAAGLHAVRYGKMRQWVEQVTLVDGRGHVHQLTGKKLGDAVGREGVTGFITNAILRLAPIAQRHSLSLHSFASDRELLAERSRWLQDKRLTALEYFNRHAATQIGWEARPHLMAEWDGGEGTILDEARIAELWKARDDLYPRLAQSGYPAIEDPQIEGDAGLAALLEWLDAEGVPAFGHLGLGIVHPCFKPGDARLEELYKLTAEHGGQVSGEHGIGMKKKAWVSAPFQEEIRQLKTIYDPKNIFNRGKLC